MRILLIYPPNTVVYDKFKRVSIKKLPISLAYLAAYLEKHEYEVEVLDAETLDYDNKEIIKHVKLSNPDVIGFSCTTPLFPVSVELSIEIKQILPEVKIILGGPHISALPKESLSYSNSIDFVVCGEGEQSLLDIIKALQTSGQFKNIPGIGYRDNGHIIINPGCDYIKDIDTIPFPARHLFPLERYKDPTIKFDEKYTILVTSRGCPFNCIFCASSVTWKRIVRFRSPENVLKEIEEIVNNHGIKNITFSDDTFTIKKDRIIEICKGIIEKKFDVRFLCSSRIDTIDEELLEWLKEAGCKMITFGVETGSPEIIKNIKKNIDIEKVPRIFQLVKKHGIKVHSSYIIGNPGDTHETIERTIQFAIDSGTDEAQFSISTPFPGTELWNLARQKNCFKTSDFLSYKWYYSVVANLSNVDDLDLIEYQKKAYNLFNKSRVQHHQV